MNKAIFLDRDGVLNRELGDYVCRLEDFEVLPDVARALRIFQDKGYLLIVVTNQGGIAKGWYSHETLHRMHEKLRRELDRRGVVLSEIYYSPQHPLYTGNSLCRKPGSMMLEKALARFDIDPERSYLIGDRDRDLEAANKLGISGILIDSDQSLMTVIDKIK